LRNLIFKDLGTRGYVLVIGSVPKSPATLSTHARSAWGLLPCEPSMSIIVWRPRGTPHRGWALVFKPGKRRAGGRTRTKWDSGQSL